ncbi:hypothetical protein DMENIID0001_042240 [Sergentomyia squamirostris]
MASSLSQINLSLIFCLYHQIAVVLLIVVSVVVAKPKPAVITYSAPYAVAAEPAAAVVESTYHGVSAPLVAAPVVSAAYSAPLLATPNYAYANYAYAYPYAANAVYV